MNNLFKLVTLLGLFLGSTTYTMQESDLESEESQTKQEIVIPRKVPSLLDLTRTAIAAHIKTEKSPKITLKDVEATLTLETQELLNESITDTIHSPCFDSLNFNQFEYALTFFPELDQIFSHDLQNKQLVLRSKKVDLIHQTTTWPITSTIELDEVDLGWHLSFATDNKSRFACWNDNVLVLYVFKNNAWRQEQIIDASASIHQCVFCYQNSTLALLVNNEIACYCFNENENIWQEHTTLRLQNNDNRQIVNICFLFSPEENPSLAIMLLDSINNCTDVELWHNDRIKKLITLPTTETRLFTPSINQKAFSFYGSQPIDSFWLFDDECNDWIQKGLSRALYNPILCAFSPANSYFLVTHTYCIYLFNQSGDLIKTIRREHSNSMRYYSGKSFFVDNKTVLVGDQLISLSYTNEYIVCRQAIDSIKRKWLVSSYEMKKLNNLITQSSPRLSANEQLRLQKKMNTLPSKKIKSICKSALMAGSIGICAFFFLKNIRDLYNNWGAR